MARLKSILGILLPKTCAPFQAGFRRLTNLAPEAQWKLASRFGVGEAGHRDASPIGALYGARCPFRRFGVLVLLACIASQPRLPAQSPSSRPSIRLEEDNTVTLRFYGSHDADLFTREIQASFDGVLKTNFYAQKRDGFPAGFISASAPGMGWAGTMWSRDGGTFMRELVMRGYVQHASLLAECLMHLVEKNPDGFYAFPRYFAGSTPGTGSELDGTASIVIAMTLLWQRLPTGDPVRRDIQKFLFQPASPANGFRYALNKAPLLAGSGEFGCGDDAVKLCYNSVQNNLAMLSLLAMAEMAGELGENNLGLEYTDLARGLKTAMEKYLVAGDGSWIWCIDPETLKPVPTILDDPRNLGVGSQNGVASMYADLLGLTPEDSVWADVDHNENTFERLYETPQRKTEFNHYGIWTQFDVVSGGLLTSPSYGQGYALQTMLLYDKLSMAGKALDWLAHDTYKPVPEYTIHRSSPYYFHERMYSPDAVGKVPLDEGCGALNLVNVSEPLKISRLILGVDDHDPAALVLVPRVPPQWKGVEAENWPILTSRGIVRAHIRFEHRGTGAELTLQLATGEQIEHMRVRMPSKNGYTWLEEQHVASVHMVTQ